MNRRIITYSALSLIFGLSTGLAQNTPPSDRSPGLPPATAPSVDTPEVLPPAAGPKKPGMQQVRPNYTSNPSSYPSSALTHPSSASRQRTQKIDPNSLAAQQQSGLNQAEATSLMTTRGYTHLGEVRADPNSIWVWQADAMRNGRRVHLGIDNRGNLVDLSASQTQPCTAPTGGFGIGPLGVGSRLSDVTNCTAR